MAADLPPNLSHACWRCKHYAGLVVDGHARCTGPHASLQANPMTGCAFRKAGPGDAQLRDWLPTGFKPREDRDLGQVGVNRRAPTDAAAR